VETEATDTAPKRAKAERKWLKPAEPFECCTQCGYEKGFHLVPIRGRHTTRPGCVALLLKCPNCGAMYDAGLAGVQ